jgi:hypothetical protein
MELEDIKKGLFSETETEDTKLTRPELVDEIRKVTNIEGLSDLDKLLEIKYLIKHYFVIDMHEELPDLYIPPENEKAILVHENAPN